MEKVTRLTLTLSLLLASAWLLASCSKFTGPSDRLTIEQFTADAASGKVGTTVVIRWSVSDRATVRIEPEPLDVAATGSRAVNVRVVGPNVFTLYATRGAQREQAVVTVTGLP